MNLKEAVDYFLIEQQLKGNTAKTIHGYRGFLRRFSDYMVGQGVTDITGLTIDGINRYQLYVNGKKSERGRNETLTKRSVQTYIRHIKVFVGFCFEKEFIREDISKKIRMPKAERPVIEILTGEEIEVIFSCYGKSELGYRNTAIVCLMLDCGLRLEEVALVKREDINFERGYITVMGKGRKGRIVPLGLKMRRALMNYIHKRRMADDPNDDKYFFLNRERRPLKKEAISSLMERLKRQTGISRLHAHLFRHTYATNFLVHGVGDVYELSRILGHESLQVTDRYLQLASYYAIMEKRGRKTYLDMIK